MDTTINFKVFYNTKDLKTETDYTKNLFRRNITKRFNDFKEKGYMMTVYTINKNKNIITLKRLQFQTNYWKYIPNKIIRNLITRNYTTVLEQVLNEQNDILDYFDGVKKQIGKNDLKITLFKKKKQYVFEVTDKKQQKYKIDRIFYRPLYTL